jgi:hypothetical protein
MEAELEGPQFEKLAA